MSGGLAGGNTREASPSEPDVAWSPVDGEARVVGQCGPDDVSVIGFDNLDLCAYVTPKLTTISQDIARKAAIAVEMLIDSIEGRKNRRKPVTIEVRLVERASTAPPAGRSTT